MTGHCYLLFVLSQLLGHPEGHIDINDFASLPAFPLQVHFCPAKRNKTAGSFRLHFIAVQNLNRRLPGQSAYHEQINS